MKIIKGQNDTLLKIWGKGKPEAGRYRLFSYLIFQPCPAGTLVYNVLSEGMILISDEEKQQISKLPCKYSIWMDGFIENHIIEREESNDRITVQNLRTIVRKMTQGRGLTSFVILPTTCCNARCFYCYEKGVEFESMTYETAEKTVAFITDHSLGQKVTIYWIGGEPMLGENCIDNICAGLRRNNVEFESHITTNGYLCNESAVVKARDNWNLTNAQVTLDGTERVYNKIKEYINACESPFLRVLDNISCMIDNDIMVSIRLNIGLHNIDDIKLLVWQLSDRFRGRDRVEIYTHLLLNNGGAVPMRYSEKEWEYLIDEQNSIDGELEELGLGRCDAMNGFVCFHCLADRDSSVMILPSGKLGKCETHLENQFIGNLDDGINDPYELLRVKETVETPNCDNCILYPSCIMLKTCAIQNECTETSIKYSIEKIRKQMLKIYQDKMVTQNI